MRVFWQLLLPFSSGESEFCIVRRNAMKLRNARSSNAQFLGPRDFKAGYRTNISPQARGLILTLKTVKREEPIIRNRFTDCPECKTRNFKVKKAVEVGRCRSCHESYKIITVYAKTSPKTSPKTKQPAQPRTTSDSSLPSWQLPSDTSLFGATGNAASTFSSQNFAWGKDRKDESETTSGQ